MMRPSESQTSKVFSVTLALMISNGGGASVGINRESILGLKVTSPGFLDGISLIGECVQYTSKLCALKASIPSESYLRFEPKFRVGSRFEHMDMNGFAAFVRPEKKT